MSAEFSLLQHLGVCVEKCDPPTRTAPGTTSDTSARSRDAFRVWAPAQHPPTNKTVPAERARSVLQHNRKGPNKSYADPTGEVLVRHEQGAEVQYVVYNSKYPSVHGVNKQLAERKAAERARESAAAATAVQCGLSFGEDEARQEEARQHILRELHECNRDQANRRREEERRDRERRIAQEKELLRYRDVEAARSEQEAHAHRVHQEEAMRRAAAEAIVAKKKAAAAAAAEAAESAGNTASAWNGADEDERRRCAALRRTREFAEANRRVAEQLRDEQAAAAAAERERATTERTAEARMQREEHQHEAERHRRTAEALRSAQEAERERRLAAASRGDRTSPVPPAGSLFDFAEQRESVAAQRAQQRLREDMAVNARLAETKRTAAKEERARERQHAAAVAEANFEAFQREVAETQQRRYAERKELQRAAAAAAAESREAQQRAARVDASRPDDALLFWGREDSVRAAETRADAQRHFYADLRRQADRKAAERAAEAQAERAREKALVEFDAEVARAAAASERKESQEKMAELRRTLETQMAAKRRAAQHGETAGQSDVLRVPAPDVVSLYRCPVTHELLPASAYDFGVQRGR